MIIKSVEKGNIGYLDYRKKLFAIITAIAFIIVFTVLFIGIIIFKSKTNYMTVLSVVLVLPAAKFATGLLVLLPHKACTKESYNNISKANNKACILYDLVIGNSKKPVGIQSMFVTDSSIYAFSYEDKTDKTFFENSLRDFCKNDKCNVTVTLYFDEKKYIDKINSTCKTIDFDDELVCKKIELNSLSALRMCL